MLLYQTPGLIAGPDSDVVQLQSSARFQILAILVLQSEGEKVKVREAWFLTRSGLNPPGPVRRPALPGFPPLGFSQPPAELVFVDEAPPDL